MINIQIGMKKVVLFLSLMVFTVGVWAESPEKRGLNVINKTNAEAYIRFLASDFLEGREAGSRGGNIAGEYIVSNLKLLGIAPLFDSYYHHLMLMVKRDKRKDVFKYIRIQ